MKKRVDTSLGKNDLKKDIVFFLSFACFSFYRSLGCLRTKMWSFRTDWPVIQPVQSVIFDHICQRVRFFQHMVGVGISCGNCRKKKYLLTAECQAGGILAHLQMKVRTLMGNSCIF